MFIVKKKKSLSNEAIIFSRLQDHLNKKCWVNKNQDVAYFQDLENTYKRNRLNLTKRDDLRLFFFFRTCPVKKFYEFMINEQLFFEKRNK